LSEGRSLLEDHQVILERVGIVPIRFLSPDVHNKLKELRQKLEALGVKFEDP
jgi:hypothetical protein